MATSRLRNLSIATLAAASLIASTRTARADEVSPDAKGITGGVMLGAEVVTIPMALFGVKSGLAYGIGGGLGAIGGGIGGYFIEDASTDGRVPTYMMAGGLALLIPTTILIMNATRYQASEKASEDKAPTNEPPADPGDRNKSIVTPSGGASVGGSVSGTGSSGTGSSGGGTSGGTTTPATPATTTPTTPSGGQTPPLSLFHYGTSGLRLGLPIPEVRQMYSLAERRNQGLPEATEVRVPVLRGSF